MRTNQEVPGVLSSSKKEPIRADVQVRAAPPAGWEYAEIKIRHPFNSDGDSVGPRDGGVDAHLERVEAGVYAHYRPKRVRPWVVSSFGRPGAALANELRRLARLRLSKPDVARAVSLPSILQLLLRRWRAELSCAIVLGDMGVYMAALNTAWEPCEVRAGGPPRLYELQRGAFGPA